MKIATSTNYDKFKLLDGNRTIKPSHVQKLVYSMTNKYIAVPVIVNERNQIIDGQHRIAACRELKKPFHYIQIDGLSLRDVQILNSSSKNWSLNDYMNSYIDLGNKNYSLYRRFDLDYIFHHECNFLLLKGINRESVRKDFKDGLLTLNKREIDEGNIFAAQASQIVQHFNEHYRNAAKSRKSVTAFVKAFTNPQYNHNRLIVKLKATKEELCGQSSTQDYIRQLESIYFHKVPERKRFRLDIN